MHRSNLRDHLRRARAHVTLGERNIDRQHETVETLLHSGHDTFEAEKLLRLLETTQRLFVADVERLERLLQDSRPKAA